MTSIPNPLDLSKLYLRSVSVENNGSLKCFYLTWLISDYDKIKNGIYYKSHYIKIGEAYHYLVFHRFEYYDRYYRRNITAINIAFNPDVPSNVDAQIYILNSCQNEVRLTKCDTTYSKEETPGTISNNKLQVQIKLNIPAEDEAIDIVLPLIEFENYFNLSKRISGLFSSGNFSDLKIVVGEKVFDVHRAVLAGSSAVFAKMLDTDMIEKKENKICIEDCTIEHFRMFLNYIYSGRLEPLTEESALELFNLAEKYALAVLKSETGTFLGRNLSIENVIDRYKLAEACQESNLKTAAVDFIAGRLPEIMKSPDWPSLRASASFMDFLLPVLGERAVS